MFLSCKFLYDRCQWKPSESTLFRQAHLQGLCWNWLQPGLHFKAVAQPICGQGREVRFDWQCSVSATADVVAALWSGVTRLVAWFQPRGRPVGLAFPLVYPLLHL